MKMSVDALLRPFGLDLHDGRTAPSPALWFTDYPRSLVDFGTLTMSWPLLAWAPKGDGHPVLVLPGLATSDPWTLALRGILNGSGYRAFGWGLGRNRGPTAKIVEGMRTRVTELASRYDQPVSIIGWSLGGIFARQIARRTPNLVRQVITLGSPIRLADHDQSNARKVYEYWSGQHVEELPLPLEDGEAPLPVPATSIYSRLDGIVAWRTCLDLPGEQAENIEVRCSHFGFGNHPAALWAVLDRLAEPVGQWRPFTPPKYAAAAFPDPVSP